MGLPFQRSSGGVFVRSLGAARNGMFPITEQMSVAALLSRNGFAKFVQVANPYGGNRLATQDQSIFSPTIYLKLKVTAVWESGNTATFTAVVDPFYGDMTVVSSSFSSSGNSDWNAGISTNIPFAGLSSNVNLGGFSLTAKPGSGDTDPTSAPDLITIDPDGGTSATATWITTGLVVTALFDTSDPANQMAYADNVATCTRLLQYATLLDDIAAPSKTYTGPFGGPAAGLPGSDQYYLRFPSSPVYINGGNEFFGANIANNTNLITIFPSRGKPNGVDFNMTSNPEWVNPATGLSGWNWASARTKNDPGGIFFVNGPGFSYQVPFGPYFCRAIFAYGMVTAAYPVVLNQGTNAIVSLKTAIRCKQPVIGAFKNVVNNVDGTFATTDFAPPDINSHSGYLIFDPVSLLASKPAGYVLDPSNGRYFVESLAPFVESDNVFGSAEWNYI